MNNDITDIDNSICWCFIGSEHTDHWNMWVVLVWSTLWDLIDIDLDTDLSFSTQPLPRKQRPRQSVSLLTFLPCVHIDHLGGPLFNNSSLNLLWSLLIVYMLFQGLKLSNIVKIETLNSLGKYLLEEQVHILASLMGCSEVTIISTNKTLVQWIELWRTHEKCPNLEHMELMWRSCEG
ncbi:hypothetical protein BDB01DRAFT_830556 [Pilobolus umbonatus]|nr:hypothetical protein BDB01DRAFT_830556 [Pilobolus umbonatus]